MLYMDHYAYVISKEKEASAYEGHLLAAEDRQRRIAELLRKMYGNR